MCSSLRVCLTATLTFYQMTLVFECLIFVVQVEEKTQKDEAEIQVN